MPALSAIRVIATISSQSARQRSGARLMVRPPSQLALNTPSLKRLGPNSGLLARDGCIVGQVVCDDVWVDRLAFNSEQAK